MRNGRIKENSTKRGVHFVRVCVGQFASRYDNVHFVPCFEVKDKVERPRATTGLFPRVGFVILQQFPPVPSGMELSHAGIGDGQHRFHVLVPLRGQHGRDQVPPLVRRGENACRTERLGWWQLLKMGTPGCPEHKDKHKATWVTHCLLQVTAAAWAGDQLSEVMKARAHLTPECLRRRQPLVRGRQYENLLSLSSR